MAKNKRFKIVTEYDSATITQIQEEHNFGWVCVVITLLMSWVYNLFRFDDMGFYC